MTTISAGTTSTTAYVATSDTTGALVLKTGASNATALTLDASQNATFAGAVSGGSTFLVPNAKVYRLDAPLAGANVNTAQAMLGVGITLAANTVYVFEYVYAMSKAAGTTSHTISLGFGGTATVNNIAYNIIRTSGNTAFVDFTTTTLDYLIQTAASTAITGAITTAARFEIGSIKGTVSINAGGTFIPQYTLSAAPGGAYTTAAGSYIVIYPIGAAGANTNVGGWA